MTRPRDPGAVAPTIPAPRIEAPREGFAVGDVVGGAYEIRGVLGRGGMGEVFEAYDRALRRVVALKVPWRSVDPRTIVAEAQALAAMRHAAMVTVHALGEHDGLPFVVMERILGVRLDEHVRRRTQAGESFSIAEVTSIMTLLADGLLAVHRAGVSHRDVKPENVILAPGNRLVLIDFGIVRPEFDRGDDATMSGSPSYMAPETIAGTVEVGAGHLVDVYALGVIGFELLTGRLPFAGETVRDVLVAHLGAPIPDPASLRAGIPDALAKLVRALLAKSPGERPQGMEDVLAELRSISSAPRGEAARANDGEVSVLVVDDDRDIARLLGVIAKKFAPDATLVFAHDGEQALAAISQRVPDVMLLDLHMPRMNGVEVCMYLRGIDAEARCSIVAVSAGAQPNDVELLRSLGVRDFVVKGADMSKRVGAALLSALRRAR
jgi:serine/threonine-protein kinase